MLIDWFTVIAQVLNFLILMWLLKRFLYKPILDAIDTREKRIAEELANAATKQAEAMKERAEFQKKNEDFDKQRARLLSNASKDAETERQRLVDEAKKVAEALSARRQETFQVDAKNLNQALYRRTQEEVFAIARKTLADLASTSLEERATDVFNRRLREIDGQVKERLVEAIHASSDPVNVRSAFDLPQTQRVAIQTALNETLSADVHILFETSPDLVSGIELAANGQKVSWTIAGYLASMEKGVHELLNRQPEPEKATP